MLRGGPGTTNPFHNIQEKQQNSPHACKSQRWRTAPQISEADSPFGAQLREMCRWATRCLGIQTIDDCTSVWVLPAPRPQMPAQKLGTPEDREPGREGPKVHTVCDPDRKEPGENPRRRDWGGSLVERGLPQPRWVFVSGEASAGEGAAELPNYGPNFSRVVCQAPSGSDSSRRGMHTNNWKAGSEGLTLASLGPAWGQLASACLVSGPPGRVG